MIQGTTSDVFILKGVDYHETACSAQQTSPITDTCPTHPRRPHGGRGDARRTPVRVRRSHRRLLRHIGHGDRGRGCGQHRRIVRNHHRRQDGRRRYAPPPKGNPLGMELRLRDIPQVVRTACEHPRHKRKGDSSKRYPARGYRHQHRAGAMRYCACGEQHGGGLGRHVSV